MKKIIFLIILILPLFYSCSKYGKIEGKVVDKLSGKPIEGASVSIKGTNLQTNTKSDGTFILEDVIPGIQKIVVSKDSFISLSESELTVAKGTTSKSVDLVLIQKPSDVGLFVIGKTLSPIARINNRDVHLCGLGILINSIDIPNSEKIDSINFLLYEGESSNYDSELLIYSMRFYPAEEVMFTTVPDRWVQQDQINNLKTESINKSLTQITGKLSQGTYCIRLRRTSGSEDWHFVFDVK